tara:strand:+ start:89 stop:658 length:570 start_codon:yes stop_codon:yes gene_type:complete
MAGPTSFGYQNLGFGAGVAASAGSLQLIETKTVSGTPSTLSFDSIQESTYNVHFMTITNNKPQTDDRHLALRFKTGGSTDSGSNYKFAMQRNNTGSSEVNSNSDSKIWLAYNVGLDREGLNGYFYIYNAGDSAKYTFVTSHNVHYGVGIDSNFQSGVYNTANVVNGIEFSTSGDPLEHGTFSLYGIAES